MTLKTKQELASCVYFVVGRGTEGGAASYKIGVAGTSDAMWQKSTDSANAALVKERNYSHNSGYTPTNGIRGTLTQCSRWERTFTVNDVHKKMPCGGSKKTVDLLWLALAVSILTTIAAPAIAKEKKSCDCMDIKLEPSKDRIKITRAIQVTQLLKAVGKNHPTEIGLLNKIVAVSDEFLQRHMNGDIDQVQAPDDWRDYNGPIMAMNMDEWVTMASERSDRDYSHWTVCPRAQAEALISSPNRTVIRYDFVVVGRFTRVGKSSYNTVFNDAENGGIFSIEVAVNDQAKVAAMRQTPQGQYSSPYTTVVRTLSQRIKKKPATGFGETMADMRANNAQYASEIDILKKAAKVCERPTKSKE